MYIRICVYMYICIHVYMYICIYIYIHGGVGQEDLPPQLGGDAVAAVAGHAQMQWIESP